MNVPRLPRGFRYVETIDLMRSRATLKAVVTLMLALTALTALLGALLCPVGEGVAAIRRQPWLLAAALAAYIVYIPLHEWVHGIFMWALSGVKPRYGLQLPYYAWAGSSAWFDRRSHNLIALAPLVLFTALLALAAARLPRDWFWPVWLIMIGHVSGCAGDVWCAAHIGRMEGEILVQDTGVRMRVYRQAAGPDDHRESEK